MTQYTGFTQLRIENRSKAPTRDELVSQLRQEIPSRQVSLWSRIKRWIMR